MYIQCVILYMGNHVHSTSTVYIYMYYRSGTKDIHTLDLEGAQMEHLPCLCISLTLSSFVSCSVSSSFESWPDLSFIKKIHDSNYEYITL